MSARHTPGPWDANGLTVYDTCMDSVASTHNAADAYLIAAAPDLLEAAEALMSSVFAENYRLISPFKELAAAIAKSRGGDA